MYRDNFSCPCNLRQAIEIAKYKPGIFKMHLQKIFSYESIFMPKSRGAMAAKIAPTNVVEITQTNDN